MKVRIIDSGRASATSLMEKDSLLLRNLQEEEIILHLYEWSNPLTVTHGHFINPKRFLIVDNPNLDVAKRPTGGGITFHFNDYAFSMLISSTHPVYKKNLLDNYQTVNQFVSRALKQVFVLDGVLSVSESTPEAMIMENFCSTKLSKYDVVMGNKKIGGAAQRSLKQGFLHQGTIFLSQGCKDTYCSILQPEVVNTVLVGIRQNAFFPLGTDVMPDVLADARQQVKHQLIKQFSVGDL